MIKVYTLIAGASLSMALLTNCSTSELVTADAAENSIDSTEILRQQHLNDAMRVKVIEPRPAQDVSKPKEKVVKKKSDG